MPKIALTGGAYQSRSVVANAQRAVNLYPEKNPEDAPFPFTHYPTPGLTVYQGPVTQGTARGIYRATDGNLYVVVGSKFCKVQTNGSLTYSVIGTISSLLTPVSMVDNGLCLVIVDGTSTGGWVYDLSGTGSFGPIVDPAFLGGTIVDYVDTFFLFNRPGTNQWYYSLSNATYAMLALGGVATVSVTAEGSGYPLGQQYRFTSANISTTTLTGGGSGAVASIIFQGGSVAGVNTIASGSGYNVGDTITVTGYGQITGGTFTGGSGYTNGSYVAVPLSGGTGHGSGALVDVVVSGGAVTSVIINSIGTRTGVGYQVGDSMQILVPGGGSGANFTVSTVVSTGTGAVIQITGVIGGVPTTTTVTQTGSNYPYGPCPVQTYTNIPATATGLSSGATLNITTGPAPGNNADYSAVVTSATVNTPGTGYAVGTVFGITLGGMITGLSIPTAGTGYTNGTYVGITLIGGSGSGAVAEVVIASGAVSSVTVQGPNSNCGAMYVVGDVLTFTLPDGLGSGATLTVSSVAAGTGAQFTVTAVSSTGFNPLNIAAKTGFADKIVTMAVMHREIWLIGELTTEIWYDVGAADFTFGIMPGTFIEHGCAAPYSIAKQDLNLFWLANDKQGNCLVLMGAGYAVRRISTHAIEYAIRQYSTISDAVGFTYQQDGHVFYVLNFPTADATWVYDVNTELWHQRMSLVPGDATYHMHPGYMGAFALNKNFVLNYSTGILSYYDQTQYLENGYPVQRIRGFPHIQNDGKKIFYTSFIADIEAGAPFAPTVPLATSNDNIAFNVTSVESIALIVGAHVDFLISATNGANSTLNVNSYGAQPLIDINGNALGAGVLTANNQIGATWTGTGWQVISVAQVPLTQQMSLRWSDDRGVTFGNNIEQTMGNTGQFRTSVKWNRLGRSRDRVFELSWSTNAKSALNGAFVQVAESEA